MILVDYQCPSCGTFESLVDRPAPDEVQCDCGKAAHWVPSPVFGHVKPFSVTQGKVAKAERPTWTDTELAGERGGYHEWKKKRDQVWRDHRYKQNVADGRKGMA